MTSTDKVMELQSQLKREREDRMKFEEESFNLLEIYKSALNEEEKRNEILQTEKNDALKQLEEVKKQLKKFEEREFKESRFKDCSEEQSSPTKQQIKLENPNKIKTSVRDEIQKKWAVLKTKLNATAKEVEELAMAEIESINKSRKEAERRLREEERNRDKLMDEIKSLKKAIEARDKKLNKKSSKIDELKLKKKSKDRMRKEKHQKERSELKKKIKVETKSKNSTTYSNNFWVEC